jgi:hypothetical protein
MMSTKPPAPHRAFGPTPKPIPGYYIGEPDLGRLYGWAHGHPAREVVPGAAEAARRSDERAYGRR